MHLLESIIIATVYIILYNLHVIRVIGSTQTQKQTTIMQFYCRILMNIFRLDYAKNVKKKTRSF